MSLKKFFLLCLVSLLSNSYAMMPELTSMPDEVLLPIIKQSITEQPATKVLSLLRSLNLSSETLHRVVQDKTILSSIVGTLIISSFDTTMTARKHASLSFILKHLLKMHNDTDLLSLAYQVLEDKEEAVQRLTSRGFSDCSLEGLEFMIHFLSHEQSPCRLSAFKVQLDSVERSIRSELLKIDVRTAKAEKEAIKDKFERTYDLYKIFFSIRRSHIMLNAIQVMRNCWEDTAILMVDFINRYS